MKKYTGLTAEEVKQREEKKLVNYDTTIPTKSIKRILFDNFFTLFNFLNLFLAICIFAVGSYKNMLFLLIVIINTAISTFQEIHAKKVIDKLSFLSSQKVTVFRDGKKQQIPVHSLVLDDIVELTTGNQIATDSMILEGSVQVNESFITGEPDAISKTAGDSLLSGSYMISGKCVAKVTHIGEENYTAKISAGSKYVKKVNSEIMNSLKKLIKWLTFAIIPIGLALFFVQYILQGLNLTDATIKTVAAIIGMIPEGLVLLTSTVLAVSVIRLSKSNVLVQELYCIETLARVDTLCFDKTGTLTEGKMEVKEIIPFSISQDEFQTILWNISQASEDENSTMQALRDYPFHASAMWNSIHAIAFSSQRKWSAVSFADIGTYVIGAPEFILTTSDLAQVEPYTQNYRVLAVAHCKNQILNATLPNDLKFVGLVCILDKIRPEAKDTVCYFYRQGVDIKIISGDNPLTVSQIAKQVGIQNFDAYIDMSLLPENTDFKEIVAHYTIFGRVSPIQKKELVLALQNMKKTVAMTGDGVNDVLALKASDCSIAMANGSDASKNVSQLVLLDSNFASMPKIVLEGRRTINNIQRSASLFLVKTIYSTFLAVLFLFMGQSYPFMPIQLSLISLVTIGIPSFVLALEPNKERIQGHFLQNVLAKSLPTGFIVTLNIFVLTILHKFSIIPNEFYTSLCVISTGICGIILLFTLAKSRKSENAKIPFSPFRLSLAILMTLLFILGLTCFGWWFNIAPLPPMLPYIGCILCISLIYFALIALLTH